MHGSSTGLNPQGIRRAVLVLGASAGGLEPTYTLLAKLPRDLPLVIAVVLHRGALGGPSLLADVLARRSGRRVVEPTRPQTPVPGTVYLAPRDQHMVFQGGALIAIHSAKQHFTRPAVDPLFVSAANAHGPHVVGLLLSGGGGDGVAGMIRIKEKGGLTLVQRPDEAPQPWMPAQALREDHVDAALSLDELVRVIPELALGHEVKIRTPIPSTAWAKAAEVAATGRNRS